MLTEHEVSKSWGRLFKGDVDEDTFRKAEQLLEELRPESPLRHRLSVELEELMQLKQPAKKKPRRSVASTH